MSYAEVSSGDLIYDLLEIPAQNLSLPCKLLE